MPLIGIPESISADLLFALARAGHGDKIVIADANFPSDSISASAVISAPIRVNATTSQILGDILKLLPLDQYMEYPIAVMDRVPRDKERKLLVPAYAAIAEASRKEIGSLEYVERFKFYDLAKNAFVVIQTNDSTLYANPFFADMMPSYCFAIVNITEGQQFIVTKNVVANCFSIEQLRGRIVDGYHLTVKTSMRDIWLANTKCGPF